MTTASGATPGTARDVDGTGYRARRLSTETKASYKTTELAVYVLSVLGVLLASWLVATADGHNDYFRADKAWWYITLLTIGYMVSRGLAKAGSRDPYDER